MKEKIAMKINKTAFFLFHIIIISIITNCDNNTPYTPPVQYDKNWKKYEIRANLTTQQLIEEMGMGINLGNTLECYTDEPWFDTSIITNYETAWGSPVITEAMIRGYADAGFNSLRIPVAWSNMMRPNYVIHPDLFDRVEAIVNWTIDSGMVALVNLHHDAGWWEGFADPAEYEECRRKFIAIWTQVSARFNKYGDRLMFESMNEVVFDSIWNQWGGTYTQKQQAFGLVNEMNQIFVDTVRASGGNNASRHLLIEVYNTGSEYAYDPLFKMPNDPARRMAATVHYYEPAVFAILNVGQVTDWGTGVATWGTSAELKELNDCMELLKKNCVDKGIPIIVGEFAACGTGKSDEMRRLYAVKVAEAAYSRGMCPMLWDTAGDQYDRDTQTWRDPLFIPQMMAIKAKYPR
jgi:endoglucanase